MVVATTTAAGVAVAAAATVIVVPAAVVGEATTETTAPLHRLPAKAGAAPPGGPSTTPRLAPSTVGWARLGHRSRLDHRTPSSLHRRWGHRSRLLWHLCQFLTLLHLNNIPRRRGQGSGIHSPSPARSAPWSSLLPTPAIDWVADSGASNHTTPYSGNISSHRPLWLSISTPSLLVMVPFYLSPQYVIRFFLHHFTSMISWSPPTLFRVFSPFVISPLITLVL
jgi:hypothetical protein